MATQAISAGKAFLELLVEDKEFAKGLDGSLQKMQNFGRSAMQLGATIAAAGAAITAPFAGALKVFADAGSELIDMSGRTGIAVEKLSALKYAAEQSGAGIDNITAAARNLVQKGLDPNKIEDYIREVVSVPDPVLRAQRAFELFGSRAGQALLPVVGQIDELTKEARESGIVMSEETARAADKLGDAFGLLQAQGKAVAIAIGAALAPTVTELVNKLSRVLPLVIDFISQHETIVIVAAAAGAGLLGLGTAIAGIGAAAFYARNGVVAFRIALTALSRHPYAIAFTVIGAALVYLAEQFFLTSEAAEDAAGSMDKASNSIQSAIDPTKALAAATEDLAEAQEKSVFQQALARMESEKNSDAVQKEVDSIKKQNDELERRYRLMRERNIPTGTRSSDPRFDPNFDNPLAGVADVEQGRVQWGKLRDLFSGGSEIDQQLQESKQKIWEAEEQARAAREEAARRAMESIQSQMDSFSRPTRHGTGGRFAEQIFGTTKEDATERRHLKVDEESKKVLDQILLQLKQAKPLMAGNS